MASAVTAALPASEGGTARDTEAATLEVASRGAFAALATRNVAAYQFFMAKLPDGPHRRELLALENDTTGQPVPERVAAWADVLEHASDDSMAARCIAALAELGHWPAHAEELHDRSVLPDDAYEILRAICRAKAGETRSALAAGELMELLEQLDGPGRAIEEGERQVSRWPVPALTLRLLDLLGRTENFERAEELIRRIVSDDSFPRDERLRLCNWYVARKGSEREFAEAAAFATRGLETGDDSALAWNLIKTLHNDGKVIPARAALARYQPEPVTQDEIGLWMQLHLGVPLTVSDARDDGYRPAPARWPVPRRDYRAARP